ncbi:coil containing protein [Vibrio phage 1.247.A._10N.261.54.E12]|nr:coil containing protein [Vibrio phage 1.247.A._10N.261.54.E12]AUR98210.1 coil containing protein [Vibrio phage 1.247.B._10N.261.54.E12]
MKMKEHFPEAFQVDHNKSFEVQDATWYSYGEKYESDGDQDSAIEHAVLNHDRMVEEIAELKGAIEAAVRIKELWLPMGAFSDSPPECYAEIEALHEMANKFEKALAKLNQEGEG